MIVQIFYIVHFLYSVFSDFENFHIKFVLIYLFIFFNFSFICLLLRVNVGSNFSTSDIRAQDFEVIVALFVM